MGKLKVKVVKKKKYKVLYKDKHLVIRQYSPCRRTITVAKRQYFLQFPYIIFARQTLVSRNRQISRLLVAFSNRELYPDDNEAVIFRPTIPNVEGSCTICLDRDGHYWQPGNSTFTGLLNKFWAHSFSAVKPWCDSDYALHVFFGGSFRAWGKLSREEVLERLEISRIPEERRTLFAFTFGNFIRRIKDAC